MPHRSGVHQNYYVPEQSKYPFLATMSLGPMLVGAGFMLNSHTYHDGASHPAEWLLPIGFVAFSTVLWNWFATTIRENRAGLNSSQLKHSYVLGMQWFIFSEVMFFFAFFFALAYVRNYSVPWLASEGSNEMNSLLWEGFASTWPMTQTPQDALLAAGGQQVMASGTFKAASETVNWKHLPLLNTILLLASSATVHLAHNALKASNRKLLTVWLAVTLVLGFAFVGFQALEYYEAYTELGLTLASGIYGSTFFLLTGFHGFHVCLGAFMLTVMFLRATTEGHFTPEDHFGFEAASWYWHFVDVVWVCLFLFVYIL